MSNHRFCCCDTGPNPVAWRLTAGRCDGEAVVPPVPVVRNTFLQTSGCGFPGTAVLLFGGECYFWNASSSTVGIVGDPDGVSYADAEGGVSKCACFLCLEEIDPVDPVPGNPDDGAANCCPSDTGCTTFGTRTINARVNISGEMAVRTRCGNNPPFSFVENTYSFNVSMTRNGTACSITGGPSQTQPSETWNSCTNPFSTTPVIALSLNYNTDDGMIGATVTVFNLPNMPAGITGANFQLRLRGGNSDLTPSGAGWGSYVRSAYSFNEFVSGGCETQFAASGTGRWTLGGDQNRVDMAIRMSGALDNVGLCP